MKPANGFITEIFEGIADFAVLVCWFIAPFFIFALAILTISLIAVLYLPSLGHSKRLWHYYAKFWNWSSDALYKCDCEQCRRERGEID